MSNTPPDNAVEQRRKVLKGALAASGVATMGYSGQAHASLDCVQKNTITVPSGGAQLVRTQPTTGGKNWAWVPVTIRKYKDASNNQFDGFEYPAGTVYQVTIPSGSNWIHASSDPVKRSDPVSPTVPENGNGNGNDISAWLLVLFDQVGNGYVAAAPTTYAAGTTAPPLPLPAAQSCITSLKAAVPTGTIYGG